MIDISEIQLSAPEVLADPIAVYGAAREQAPLARLNAPGFGSMWAFTRHADARAMLSDPRFIMRPDSFLIRAADLSEEDAPYLQSMQTMAGAEHLRLRRLVAPAFTARRAAEFRPRVERIVAGLLDDLPEHVENGSVDLLAHFTRPLPMALICDLVGIPGPDRPAWQRHGELVATGQGAALATAVPAILAGAKATVAAHRASPGNGQPDEDLVSTLIRLQAEDGDRLSDTELVALVWQLVLAGQTPANLIANAIPALLGHPDQLAALRADPSLLPRAVEELMRWCGPQLLAFPRYATEDVTTSDGVLIKAGDAVTAALGAANRDPRVFTEPDRLDFTRTETTGHLGFAHGPHFCVGAGIARVQTEVALSALLWSYPDLTVTEAVRMPDPATWRQATLRISV